MDLNPVLTPVRDLGEFIRDQRTAAQISIRGLAAKAGVSNPYLSQVERGLRRPSAEILAQIAHGLSISVESLLAKAGILETADSPGVVVAVRADEVLTERQKSALIDIYAAFRKESEAAAALLAASVTTGGAHPMNPDGVASMTVEAQVDPPIAETPAPGLDPAEPAGDVNPMERPESNPEISA